MKTAQKNIHIYLKPRADASGFSFAHVFVDYHTLIRYYYHRTFSQEAVMVHEEVIQKWNTLLQGNEKLIPKNHLLLYDCLAEPDEDMVVFTQSFLVVGPEQSDKRTLLKRLDLSFSDFTYPGDPHILSSVLNWLSNLNTQDNAYACRGQFVTKQHNSWIPNWNTKNFYMPKGASYTPMLN